MESTERETGKKTSQGHIETYKEDPTLRFPAMGDTYSEQAISCDHARLSVEGLGHETSPTIFNVQCVLQMGCTTVRVEQKLSVQSIIGSV